MKSTKIHGNSISTRWLFSGVFVVVLILIISIITLSFSIQSYVYNGIQQALLGRSDELLNTFTSSDGYKNSAEFNTISRAYIENFPDKNKLEIMTISSKGVVLTTSTGLTPNNNQAMPDYVEALNSESNYGYWTGELETGEKVMAITRVVRNSSHNVVGSIRYVVSLELADSQVITAVFALAVIGAFITMFIILSGLYFIRSIVTPIKQINLTAKEIAKGDFDARIEKQKDDEIGQLIDTINEMAKELGNAEKVKNDFISSVSHELRTPLTSIKGWAETLQEVHDDRASFDKGMTVIIKESERLSGIVEELLDFSRIQSGRMSLMLNKVDILSELDEAVFMFTDRARGENKKLVYEESAMLPEVMADVNRLRQVFVNIIDNALKYTSEGGTITISAFERNGIVCIAVKDTGCGIPKEHLPNVKEKFYKANQVVRGSGIGLAVADEIMMLHSGRLDIESAHGYGTTVRILIPSIKALQENPQIANATEVLASSDTVQLVTEKTDNS